MKRQFNRKKRMAREPKEFDEEVIQIDRVTRVVKGGRRLRFRALVAIGNRKGKVGIGIGKSTEVSGAIKKAITVAKKSLITVPVNGTSIPHQAKVKFKSSELLLLPAGEGTGIIAGGPVRKVIALSGIKDILGKSYGSNNKINVTKAAFEALKEMSEIPNQKAPDFSRTEIKPLEAPKNRPPKRRNNRGPKKSEAKMVEVTKENKETNQEKPKVESTESKE